MSGEKSDAGKALTPPYTAYQSLKSLIGAAHDHGGAPGRYDRTVLSNYSGAVASQLLLALRFLDLTDEKGVPQPKLEKLIKSYGTDDWKPDLSEILKQGYAPIFTLNLMQASPGQFSEKFKDAYQCDGETLRKGSTFFLNAASDAGIQISPYIMKGKRTRTVTAKRRSAKTNGKHGSEYKASEEHTHDPAVAEKSHGKKRHLPGLVAALVEALPEDGQSWTLLEASEWLQTAAYNFRYAYKLDGILKVEITPINKQQ